ncbi:MAG: hypothetical protein JNJ48_05255 [Phycisphaerae bacterium]|nr:hypothetical protein [Phycisphaerae bacterium]
MHRTSSPFVRGVVAGAGGLLLIAAAFGVGRAMTVGDSHVTASADGRKAYLWNVSGNSITFVASAEADKGADGDKSKGPDGQHGKQPDKEPAPGGPAPSGGGGGGGKGKGK